MGRPKKPTRIPDDAAQYSRAELMDLAHAMGVTVPARATKAEILDLCQRAPITKKVETGKRARQSKQTKEIGPADPSPAASMETGSTMPSEPVQWPRSVGRPRKLTKEIIVDILSGLQRAAYIETAVAGAGISKDTYHRWIREGTRLGDEAEKGRDDFDPDELLLIEFSDAVKKELAKAEVRFLDRIANASRDPRQWSAAAWILERRYPEKYGRRDRHTLENPDGSSLASPLADALRIAFGPAPDESDLLPIAEGGDSLS